MKLSRAFILAGGLLFAGCASKQAVHKEGIVDRPITLALSMCAEAGTVAVSRGNEGERMVCERQTPVGTHLPTCVCRDEGMIAQQVEDTQQVIRTVETDIQIKK
jgi:hypothetical protein